MHHTGCVGALAVGWVGREGLPSTGWSELSTGSREIRGGGDEVRGGDGGGAAGQGVWAVAKVGYVGDEKLDDATVLEIEKVRRTTCRSNFSQGSLDCWIPRECPRRTDRPCRRYAQNWSPRSWSVS